MSFNDYKILTDKDYSILKTNYERIYASEVSDLLEIIDKMQEQKNSLLNNNQNGKYNQIIEKISSNISELQSLVKSSTNNSNYRSYSQPPSTASILSGFRNHLRIQNLNDPNGAIHPVRSIDEMINHNDFGTMPDTNIPSSQPQPTPSPIMPSVPQIPELGAPNQPISPIRDGNNSSIPNTPNRNIYRGENSTDTPNENIGTSPNQKPNNGTIDNSTPRSPSPANPISTNNNLRNRPMQVDIITNFIKSLKVGFSSHKARKKALNSGINYSLALHRNKYHNMHDLATQSINHNCDPHNKLVTNQIDIIRLLLLYLTLRPTCRYCSRIASITNEQFDILLNMDSKKDY